MKSKRKRGKPSKGQFLDAFLPQADPELKLFLDDAAKLIYHQRAPSLVVVAVVVIVGGGGGCKK